MSSAVLSPVLERDKIVEQVERRLQEVICVDGPTRMVMNHVFSSQGKMLRAQLVILTSSLWGTTLFESAVNAAAGVELIHRASLIHDDIVDEGVLRRGRPATYRVFGIKEAVLAGDYLFALAFSLFAQSSPLVFPIMSRAIGEMSRGEIDELIQPGRTIQEYWTYIHRKTAALLGACCEVGAVLAGHVGHWADRLREFGEAVGLAFQLTDDVLDYRGSTEKLGKAVGKDFHLEVWTLPIILAYERGLIGHDWHSQGFQRIQQLLDESGILDEVWRMAEAQMGRARCILAELPESEARGVLWEILNAISVRQS